MVLDMSDTSTESRQPDIQVAGDNARAVTGDLGTSYAGRMGVAISGDGGYSQAGDMGFAVSGDGGMAISGIGGFSIVGVGGMARSGPGGSITIFGISETGHRYGVSADIDDVNGPSADTMYQLEGHRFVLASGSRAKVV
jgi:hypothetical protein